MRQSGFGLLDVLISLLLSTIIMTTLIQFYLSNKNQYLRAQKILSNQFDLLWVTDLMSDSIRRAGFTPCLGIDQLQAVDRRVFGKKLLGIKIENHPQQLIQVSRMKETFSQLISIPNATQLIVSNHALLNEKRPIVISDCEHAEVHKIGMINKTRTGNLVTLVKPLMYSYRTSTYVGEWLEERWFIKPNAQGIPSLHYQLNQTEELTALVHSMRINEKRINEKKYLEIDMALGEDKSNQLVVAVRGS